MSSTTLNSYAHRPTWLDSSRRLHRHLATWQAPIAANITPPAPRLGAEFKKSSLHNINRSFGVGAQGASMPHRANFLDLDPTNKDAYGLPLCA
jgi:gluconate 2-dehydrogenase alpha chain